MYTYYNLEKNKELKALLSLGFSKNILIKPVLYTGILAFSFQLILHNIIPLSFKEFLHQEKIFINRINFRIFKPSQFNIVNNYVIYFSKYKQNKVSDLFVYYEKNNKQFFITSDIGSIKDSNIHNRKLLMENGTQIEFDNKDKSILKLSFKKLEVDIGSIVYKELNIRDILLGKKFLDLLIDNDSLSLSEAYTRIAKTILPIIMIVFIQFLVFNVRLRFKYYIGGAILCIICFSILMLTRVFGTNKISYIVYLLIILIQMIILKSNNKKTEVKNKIKQLA